MFRLLDSSFFEMTNEVKFDFSKWQRLDEAIHQAQRKRFIKFDESNLLNLTNNISSNLMSCISSNLMSDIFIKFDERYFIKFDEWYFIKSDKRYLIKLDEDFVCLLK
jgi:hypothetical protein